MDKQYHEDLSRSMEALCFCLSTRYASAYRWLHASAYKASRTFAFRSAVFALWGGAMVALVGLAVALGVIFLAVLIG
jgi:hypothetical protein